MTQQKHEQLSELISDLITRVGDYDKTKHYPNKAYKYFEVGRARWKIHEFMDNLGQITMETKFTKGEWVIREMHPSFIVETDETIVAIIDKWTSQDEAQPNAKLIAAAPELLEALESAVKAMKIVTSSAIKPFIRRAEAAIKKATE